MSLSPQNLEVVAPIFLTRALRKIEMCMSCLHEGQTHKGFCFGQYPRCHRDGLRIVRVDKKLGVVDEDDECSGGVEEDVDEVVP